MKKLAACLAAATLTTVGMADARAEDESQIVHAAAVPVTVDKVVVGVQTTAPQGTQVVVADASGRILGTAQIVAGKALVPVDSGGGLQRYSVSVNESRADLQLRHDENALRSSPWVVVNKSYAFDASGPEDVQKSGGVELSRSAQSAYRQLLRGAQEAGVGLWAASTYRPFENQRTLYAAYVRRDGVDRADTYSARPGHSEHQTGLAVDVASGACNVRECFADTAAGKWVAGHAHEYGFIVRYPKNEEKTTGYNYEPWHLRYVGPWLAGHLKQTKQSVLESVFDLDAAADYGDADVRLTHQR